MIDAALRRHMLFLCAGTLQSLGVPYFAAHLGEVITVECEVAFHPSRHWPHHLTAASTDEIRDPNKHIEVLTQILMHYGVRITFAPTNAHNRPQLSAPAIAVVRPSKLSSPVGTLALVIDRHNEYFDLRTSPLQSCRLSHSDLAATCTGIYLNAALGTTAAEPGYRTRMVGAIEIYGLTLSVAVFFLAALVPHCAATIHANTAMAIALASLLGVKMAAAAITYQLYQLDVGERKSHAFEQLCSLRNNFDCTRVTRSKAGNIFGLFSMAELGLAYFLGSALTLLVGLYLDQSTAVLTLSAILGVLALPYTLFSLLYQKFVVRAWCPLCVAVQLLLWCECAVGIGVLRYGSVHNITTSAVRLCAIAIAAVAFLLVRQREVEKLRREGMRERVRLRVLKANPVVFSSLLLGGDRIDDGILTSDVVFGDVGSGTRIVIVLHPQCSHCAKCFLSLQDIVGPYSTRCHVVVRVVATVTELDIARDLISTIVCIGQQAGWEYLTNWYSFVRFASQTGTLISATDISQAVYTTWKKETLDSHELSAEAAAAYERQISWEDRSRISDWPAVSVGGRSWPPYYTLKEGLPLYLQHSHRPEEVCG